MKKRAVIFSGGTIEKRVVLEQSKPDDFIIGVDKGIEFLDANGIEPHYLVGDFDSICPDLLDKYKRQSKIPIRAFDPVKDASDTEIAVRLAMELGCEELILFGATGTRIDHMWANIQVLMIPFEKNIEAKIIDGVNRISLIRSGIKLAKSEAYGMYFSVFSLGGAVTGLTIAGAKYPLRNHTLQPFDSLSVSNQFVEDEVTIKYQSGTLILMESRE